MALLQKTAKWTANTSLIEVIRAVVNYVDHPDVDYSASFGSNSTLNLSE